jgi:hypothetical protein
MSLDSSVGLVDNAVANGKGSLEKALGIGISGFIDSGYIWSSNHPGNGANISGRYFDKDNNQVNVSNFHLALEKSEKIGVLVLKFPVISVGTASCSTKPRSGTNRSPVLLRSFRRAPRSLSFNHDSFGPGHRCQRRIVRNTTRHGNSQQPGRL